MTVRVLYPRLDVEAERVSEKRNAQYIGYSAQIYVSRFFCAFFLVSVYAPKVDYSQEQQRRQRREHRHNSSSGGRHLSQFVKERRLDIITAAAAHKQMAARVLSPCLDVEAELV